MKIALFSILLFSLSVAFSAQARAQTEIAFLEVYDSHGRLVQYEPGSRFGHTALKIGDLWLQSYPGEGVKLITFEKLKERGQVTDILEIPMTVEMKDIEGHLGKAFDFQYSWSDEAFYCSELLAKILKIGPQPMEFNRALWPKSYWHLEGTPGLSPDKLHRILKAH